MTATQAIRPFRRPRLIGFVAAAILDRGRLVRGFGDHRTRPRYRSGPAGHRGDLPDQPPGEASIPGPGGSGPAAGSIERIDRSITAWSKNLAANPLDFISATNLATLFHGRGRLSYDLGDHERALAAARTAIGIEPSHVPARALEATILFTLHDFEAAFAAADALVREDPGQHERAGYAVRRRARAWPDR